MRARDKIGPRVCSTVVGCPTARVDAERIRRFFRCLVHASLAFFLFSPCPGPSSSSLLPLLLPRPHVLDPLSSPPPLSQSFHSISLPPPTLLSFKMFSLRTAQPAQVSGRVLAFLPINSFVRPHFSGFPFPCFVPPPLATSFPPAGSGKRLGCSFDIPLAFSAIDRRRYFSYFYFFFINAYPIY